MPRVILTPQSRRGLVVSRKEVQDQSLGSAAVPMKLWLSVPL